MLFIQLKIYKSCYVHSLITTLKCFIMAHWSTSFGLFDPKIKINRHTTWCYISSSALYDCAWVRPFHGIYHVLTSDQIRCSFGMDNIMQVTWHVEWQTSTDYVFNSMNQTQTRRFFTLFLFRHSIKPKSYLVPSKGRNSA